MKRTESVRQSVGHADDLARAGEHLRAGRPGDAERLCRELLAQEPGNARAVNLLGAIAFQRGNFAAAAARFAEAARLRPDLADAHANLGRALRALERLDEARESLERAQALDPEAVDIAVNLGLVLLDEKRPEDAAACFRRALDRRPEHVEAEGNLALALQAQGKLEEAEACLRRVLERAPENAVALNNLGSVLHQQDRQAEAEACYRKALAVRPGYAKALGGLGGALRQQGRLDEALAAMERSLAIDPDYAEGHHRLGWTRLLLGDLEGGWDGYEWRWNKHTESPVPPSRFKQPLWDGAPLAGRTALLWAEQGVGDEIMFAGLVPEVQAMAAHCVLECDRRLLPLFGRSFAGLELVPRQQPPDPRTAAADIAVQIPTGSLPRWLRRSLASFPNRRSYLTADAGRTAALRATYGTDRPLVGLSWHTTNPKTGRRRNFPLADWGAVLRVPGVRFVSLQYGPVGDAIAEAQARHGVPVHHDPGVDPLVDLDGLAVQVAAMDLVLSIDNSTVHLAGALGAPVWTLLPFVPDFRWFMGREDSPWYPSMRLIRQASRGDWAGLLERVGRDLANFAAKRPQGS